MLIDKIFLMLLIFFVTFSWLTYYKFGAAIALPGGILAAALVHLAIKFLFKSKREQRQLKLKERKQAQQLAGSLAFCSEKTLQKLFSEALSKGENNFTAKKNGFLAAKESEVIFLTFDFSLPALSAGFICKSVQTATANGAEEVIVLCGKADKNSFEAANLSSVKVKLCTIDGVYGFLKKRGCLPELPSAKRMRLVTLKNFGALFFHRSRAKVYLSTSIFLILFSYISMFKLYDLIMGSLLLLFSAYARFNKRFNLPERQDLDL